MADKLKPGESPAPIQDGQDGLWCTPSGSCLIVRRDGDHVVVEIDREHEQSAFLSPDQARGVARYLNEMAADEKPAESPSDSAMAAVRDIAGKR